MKYVCPECGYNAGENGEKILQIHMSAQHGPNSPQFMTPEQVAKIRQENDVLIARTFLLAGGIAVLLGLIVALYGYSIYATLTCNPNPNPLGSACFISQSLIDQINTSGYRSVYVGSQETTYGGLLLFTMDTMGIALLALSETGLGSENTARPPCRDLHAYTRNSACDCRWYNPVRTENHTSDMKLKFVVCSQSTVRESST